MICDGVYAHTATIIGKLSDRIELSSTAYEAAVLPLNYESKMTSTGFEPATQA